MADPQGTGSGYVNGFLAIGASAVFFSYRGSGASNGGMARAAKDGNGATCVACDSGEPREIVADSSRVYWADRGAGLLRSAPVSGSPVSDLWTGTIGSPLALDVNYIYWFDEGAGYLMRAGLDGSNPTVVVGGQTKVNSLAAAGGYLFWTTDTGVMADNIASQTLITLAIGRTNPKSVAADDSNAYWVEGHWNLPDNAVYKTPRDGGTVTNVTAVGSASAYAIAIDATNVCVADNYSNTIWRVSKSGGTPVYLATGQPYPFDIAVDDTYVYWTSETNAELDRVPK